MGWFNNLRVRTKLIGGFLVVAAIAAIIGGVGIRSMERISSMNKLMYERETMGLTSVADANLHLVAAGRALRSLLLTSTDEDHRNEYYSMDSRFNSLTFEFKKLESLFDTPTGKAAVAEAQAAVNKYEKAVRGLVSEQPPTSVSKAELAAEVAKSVRPLGDTAEFLMSSLALEKQKNAQKFSEDIHTIYVNTLILMIALTVGGALLAVLLGILITRGLTRQLGGEPQAVADAAGAIAQGNLNTRIDASKAHPGSVIQAMSQMQASLSKVVSSVRNTSDHIATGSSEIAMGNTNLSQRTEQQAANLTQTAAAMEQLSSTVKSNADVANQAAQMASSASAAAVQGGEVVNNVVTTMQDINTSSKKIVDIISVIDTIAFQTNILALNAAVEAARAGEQGRGFAVVASEVRSLAQKSASAAKDIKNLINDSVQKVGAGTKMADAAGEAMQGIVTHVKQVTDLINEISAATTEQTSGLGQINEAVMQLSDVTQQNAALVQESSAAADSLHEQAQRLVDTVSVFSVDQAQSNLRSQSPSSAPAVRERIQAAPEKTAAQSAASRQALPQPSAGPSSARQIEAVSRPQKNLAAQPAQRPLKRQAVKEDEWEEF